MEKNPQTKEAKVVSYEESLALAEQLDEQYKTLLIQAGMENFGHSNIPDYLRQIPDEEKNRFSAHGITRGNRVTNLAALLNILSNNAIKGMYGKLAGGHGGGWTNCDLLLISHYDRELGVLKTDQTRGGDRLEKDEIGFIADVGAFVISNKYYPVIDDLKKIYPDKNIIRAEDIPQFIDGELKH